MQASTPELLAELSDFLGVARHYEKRARVTLFELRTVPAPTRDQGQEPLRAPIASQRSFL